MVEMNEKFTRQYEVCDNEAVECVMNIYKEKPL